jgi:cytochrome c oxidase subunit II
VLLMHRAEKYDESDAEPIEGNTRLEITWTAIPLVLVMAIAGYAIRVNTSLGGAGPMEHIHLRDPVEQQGGYPGDRLPAESVEVIARQWSWEFRYPGAGVSSTELHLAVDQPVTFRLVSEDVLHGFYIPAFRLKQDVIPGSAINFNLTPTREGRYRLRDSQFSGTWFAANQSRCGGGERGEGLPAWLKHGGHPAPAGPGISDAVQEYAERLKQGNPGLGHGAAGAAASGERSRFQPPCPTTPELACPHDFSHLPRQRAQAPSWTRYFSFNTDAKVIGIQYIVTWPSFISCWWPAGDDHAW